MANVVKAIAKYIQNNAETPEAVALMDLCHSLESGMAFELARLYDLKPKAFALALGVLEEWRFDRHLIERRLQKYLSQETA